MTLPLLLTQPALHHACQPESGGDTLALPTAASPTILRILNSPRGLYPSTELLVLFPGLQGFSVTGEKTSHRLQNTEPHTWHKTVHAVFMKKEVSQAEPSLTFLRLHRLTASVCAFQNSQPLLPRTQHSCVFFFHMLSSVLWRTH